MKKSDETSSIKEASKLTVEEWREYTKTVWSIANVTDPEHPAVFPLEIPRRLIKLFTFIRETVLDPFAGVGTTADAAVQLDRKAICIEQNPNYLDVIKKRLMTSENNNVMVHKGDSRQMDFLIDGSISLIVTSPPYWNKADYGDKTENLGNIDEYYRFFQEIRPVFEESYRVLAPGRKLCIVTANVNQYTNYGLLTFPLAADYIMLMRGIGFLLVSEVIWSKDGTGGKWGSWGKQRPIFGSYPYPPTFYFKNVNEYILIFAKPPSKDIKAKKARQFTDLMGLIPLHTGEHLVGARLGSSDNSGNGNRNDRIT